MKETNLREFLLNKMPKNSTCAEIGTWKGDFAKIILSKVTPKKLFLIDPHQYVKEYDKAWYGGSLGSQKKMDDIHKSVTERFAKEIVNGQIIVVRSGTDNEIQEVEDDSLDWIYIDGNHLYDFVYKDLEFSLKKVKVNGFITGDDYNLVGWWDDGVTKAVDKFVINNITKVEIVMIKDTQFILKRIK